MAEAAEMVKGDKSRLFHRADRQDKERAGEDEDQGGDEQHPVVGIKIFQ